MPKLRFWYHPRISVFLRTPPEVQFFYVPPPPEYPPVPAHNSKSLNTISELIRSKCGERYTRFQSFQKFGTRLGKHKCSLETGLFAAH